jgi:MFS family permease
MRGVRDCRSLYLHRQSLAVTASVGPEAVELPFSLTSHRSFFQLWYGRGASVIANQMVLVAIGWQLYNLTNSPLDLGLLGLAQFVPMLLATPFAGVVADTFDRHRVVALCQALGMITASVLAIGTLGGWLGRGHIFALVACLGLTRAFEFPNVMALVPQTVPRAVLQRATALYVTAGQSALILGPALGGLIYMLHPALPYAVAVLLLLLGVVTMWNLAVVPQARRSEPFTAATVLAGAAFVKRTPELLGAMSLDLAAVVLASVMSLLPVIARDILGTGPWGLGLLRAAPGAGALVIAIWLAYRPVTAKAGSKLFGGIFIYGAATIAFGLSESLWFSLAMLVIMGAADMLSAVVRQSLVQLRTPDEMRGRVSAVSSLFIGSSNQLGELRAGLAAAALGPVTAIVTGGVAAVVAAGIWMLLFPTLRRLQRVD